MMIENKVYAEKDVYNENGVLLVAKNELLTEEIQKKLASIGNFYHPAKKALPEIPQKPNPQENMQKSLDNLQRMVNIDNLELLTHASDVLNSVLFQSKKEPWWAAVYAIENYVDWIYTHCINVSLLSSMVAIHLGYSEERLIQFTLGSFLHDVGKLLIPKSIIQKPHKLTKDEYTLMKQHCVLGFEILQESNVSQMCLDIVLQHHERLDGRGYPYGLQDGQISQEAQIVMISDVLDAMTSYRPYRSAKTMNAAFSELKRKENLFNLELVKQFAAILIPRRNS